MRVEVLICTHNGDKYLSEQIDSILSQSSPIDLLHIHDYLSTDKTRNIIIHYSNKFPNIRYIFFNDAKGPSYSFYGSMNLIRKNLDDGSLLLLSDQDDIWLENKVSQVISYVKAGVDFVFHNVEIVDENGSGRLNPEYYYGNFWRVERDLRLPNLFFSNPIIGHTVAMTGRVLKRLDLANPQSIPMHDWHIAFQVLTYEFKFMYIPNVLSLYRQHSSNILGKKSTLRALRNLNSSAKKLGNYQGYLRENYGVDILLRDALSVRPGVKFIYVLVLLTLIKIFKYDRIER